MKRLTTLFLLLCLTPIFANSVAFALPLDLSSFTAEIGVAESGGEVKFTESDSPYAYFYFFRSTFYVDPSFTSISFDYSLDIGPENDDYLVVLLDYTNYEFEVGTYNSSASDSLILSGSDAVNLIPYGNSTIDLAFGFEANDWYLDSIGAFSNIELNIATQPIPEPGSMILMGIGLLGLSAVIKKKRQLESNKLEIEF